MRRDQQSRLLQHVRSVLGPIRGARQQSLRFLLNTDNLARRASDMQVFATARNGGRQKIICEQNVLVVI